MSNYGLFYTFKIKKYYIRKYLVSFLFFKMSFFSLYREIVWEWHNLLLGLGCLEIVWESHDFYTVQKSLDPQN